MRALFTGSFDPVTNGHLDLIERLTILMDAVVVGVIVNPDKAPLFSDEERVSFLRAVCSRWPAVEVHAFRGLSVEAARSVHADILVRGIRQSGEFDREFQMAQMNRALTGIETLMLPSRADLAFVSSSLVKEVAAFGGDITPFVPPLIAEQLQARFRSTPEEFLQGLGPE